jgi:hypothetical protein
MKWILGFLALLTACSPSSLSDVRLEGEAETKRLSEELKSIETIEDLTKASPKLKKRFNKIADLLIEARQFPDVPSEPSLASEELFAELARIYEIPGGREALEKTQAEAILKLR